MLNSHDAVSGESAVAVKQDLLGQQVYWLMINWKGDIPDTSGWGSERPHRGLQEVLPESHYGLVLALQVHVPDMAIDLVQMAGTDYGPPDYPDLPSGLFCIVFSDLQATLAIDEDIRDMR